VLASLATAGAHGAEGKPDADRDAAARVAAAAAARHGHEVLPRLRGADGRVGRRLPALRGGAAAGRWAGARPAAGSPRASSPCSSAAIGAHKFYLGRWGWGIVYFLFASTLIPWLVGLVEGIVLLVMDDQKFAARYGHLTGSGVVPVVVAVAPGP